MSAIEYYKRFWAGNVAGQIEFPIVEVMGLRGSVVHVPCAGVMSVMSVDDESGHKVKVLASRYTNDNPHAHCTWIDLKPDEAVLAWRTNQSRAAPDDWVVYLLKDDAGKLIIIPRKSKPPTPSLQLVANG